MVNAIYNFWLYELCDIYLEAIKPRVQPFSTKEGEKLEAMAARMRDARCAQEVLYTCVDRGLRLLHPICPFVTEELYQRLPPSDAKAESICISNYPEHVLAWTNAALDVGPTGTLQCNSTGDSSIRAALLRKKGSAVMQDAILYFPLVCGIVGADKHAASAANCEPFPVTPRCFGNPTKG